MKMYSEPSFPSQTYRSYALDNPGKGGLDTRDLEFGMRDDQSPDMVNMMYRNGAFSKRHSLELECDLGDTILATASYKGMAVLHVGNHVGTYADGSFTPFEADVGNRKGQFIRFNGMLYYLTPEEYWQFDGTTFAKVEPYVPDVLINRSPDPEATADATDTFTGDGVNKTFILSRKRANSEGFEVKVNGTVQSASKYTFDAAESKLVFNNAPASGATITVSFKTFVNGYSGDTIDDFNLIGRAFKTTFHGDGFSTVYHLSQKNLASTVPIAKVNGEEVSAFSFDAANGIVTFETAPAEGDNNVEITAYLGDGEYLKYREIVLRCTIHACYGGGANSRLLLAGGGDSRIVYSDVFDGTYFPEQNYITIGNAEEDITGFGFQYSLLFAFKPREIHSISYYIQSSSNTTDESEYGIGAFSAMLVNASRGCDCPGTIQTISNQLVWLHSSDGVQTLVSTNISDERNVRPLSRNINGSNRYQSGILSWNMDNVVSFDYGQKYFLCNPSIGECFMWDYGIAPYTNTGRIDDDASRVSWFKFTSFSISNPFELGGVLYFSDGTKLCRIGDLFEDYGTNAIISHYMTPMLVFTSSGNVPAYEYLKNIQSVYVQTRGDTSSVLRMRYLTDENAEGEKEQEPIVVPGKLWKSFTYGGFRYNAIRFGTTFRRKCSVKKVQMMGIRFYQSSDDPSEPPQHARDMSISGISFQYVLARRVK